MCGICGCTETENTKHVHHHSENANLITIEQAVLGENNQYALSNRQFFLEKEILALNIMSSPGSGKTTLLSRTVADLKNVVEFNVIVADQQTDYDAKQMQAAGAKALQINTGKVCHLDAHGVGHATEDLSLQPHSILFIENIGNLVCPALFDLGETYRIVILSVTEGDNKPLKYPEMFRNANLMIITKLDLLPYVDFDMAKCSEYAKRINPNLGIVKLSAKNGEGLETWYQWLNQKNKK